MKDVAGPKDRTRDLNTSRMGHWTDLAGLARMIMGGRRQVNRSQNSIV